MGKININNKDIIELNINGKKINKITINGKDLTFAKEYEDHTYYIDTNGVEQHIADSAPSGTTEITHFGCDSQGGVYSAPRSLTKFTGTMSKNITSMYGMFNIYHSMELLDLSNLNTSNVTDMNSTFSVCTGLTTLDLSSWDTSNVKTMNALFDGCTGLTTLDLSNWKTSNVNDMSFMFNGCVKLERLDLSKWDTGEVSDMSSMFKKCTNLKTAGGIDKWNVSKVSQKGNFNQDSPISPIPHFGGGK